MRASIWTRLASSARLLPLALVAAATGCEPAEEPRASGRVIVIGIDGASPSLVEPWVSEGRLPVLAALARDGVTGRIRSHEPILSPRIWTSVATGKIPERHGITGWVQRNRDGSARLFRSFDRRGHALWNMVSEQGLTVGVVNWLTTFPPEKVRGVVVTDFAIPGEREGWESLASSWAEQFRAGAPFERTPDDPSLVTVWPLGWRSSFERVASDPGPLEGVDDPAAQLEESFQQIVASVAAVDRVAVKTALAIEAELRPDVMMVFLPGIDRVSHFFWGGTQKPGTYQGVYYLTYDWRRKARAALDAYYRYTDQLIGVLTAGYGPDDLVFVLSDHGFEPNLKRSPDGGIKTGTHLGEKAIEGVAFARGRGIEPGTIDDLSVNDVTPTVLAWLGLPVGRDMDGRVAGFVTDGSSRTVATWDRGDIERVTTSEGSGVEDSIVEDLRALGYVE